MNAGDDLERSVDRVSGSEPMRLGARAGLVAWGLIHLLLAWLAVRVAFGGRERADQTGALQAIAAQPFGRVLLWLVVVGFLAVVVWRVREAVWGFAALPVRDKVRKRLYAAGQVLLFLVLAGLAGRVAAGSSGGNGGQGVTSALLRVPGGRELVIAVGAGVAVAGAVMAVRGWQLMFTEDVELYRAGPVMRRWVQHLGRIGVLAKAGSVVVIGVLIALAALRYRPAEAEGLDVALRTIAAQPFGQVLLLAVAFGLASYGVFCFFDARYHRV